MAPTRSAAVVLSIVATVLSPAESFSQSYPQKPVRIVTGASGGGNDTTARLLAQFLSVSLGQNVVVDNRPGIGIIPAQTVVDASPDGYTLLVYVNTIWLLPFLQDHISYDPVKDLAPVTLAAILPQVLVINHSLPVNSVKDLIALAKAEPGTLNYSTSGIGSANHLAGELFKSMAGINMVHVPYKGTVTGTTDLIAGRIQLSFPTTSSVAPYIKAGRVKALAVTTANPSALLPELPTIAASGLPGYEAAAMLGMFAPAGTPAAIINRINQDVVKALSQPSNKEAFIKAGMEPVGSSPQQLAVTMKNDMAKMGKVIKDAGIRAQ